MEIGFRRTVMAAIKVALSVADFKRAEMQGKLRPYFSSVIKLGSYKAVQLMCLDRRPLVKRL